MYQSGGTLKSALENIEQNKWVLPAIQREFVWKPSQICTLFDSLMQGFPFGTFLFWKIDMERSADYRFYGFVRDYHERDNPHCPDLELSSGRPLIAVIDGQQRLSALNVGLRGSLAIRRKYAQRQNSNSYPKLHLHLNLLSKREDGDGAESAAGLTKEQYDFRFLEAPRAYVAGQELWFRVSEILRMQSGPGMVKWLTDKGLAGDELNSAFETLDRLYHVIHTAPVVYYYEEASPSLERVLKIFIRLNSAGTVLSQSDLLHSIAVAQWSKKDARHEIATLVDDLNRGGWFGFAQNFVLKAGLMLTDVASVGFKVENFTRPNMELLEKDWDRIRSALLMTVHLARDFGLDASTIRAHSSLLPIAYYLFKIQAPENYLTHTKYAADRRETRQWLIASLLKPSGIWGSGLDTLLTALREVIRESSADGFPAGALRQAMAQRGKSLSFDDPEIENLLDLEYGKKGTFLLLSMLYPFVDLRNKYHVDHIFPAGLFSMSALKKAGIEDDQARDMSERKNRLANLQLMDGAENNEKRKKLPAAWMEKCYPDKTERKHHYLKYDMGTQVPDDMTGFLDFYEARRARLKDKITGILNLA
jgi:hypothetical protein